MNGARAEAVSRWDGEVDMLNSCKKGNDEGARAGAFVEPF
jgi:hypothetical protein